MKFPSLFRTAKYQQFKFEPRYYDPIKEEIDQKLAAAKKELQNEKTGETNYQSNISAAFQRRQKAQSKTSTIQLLIALGLFSVVVAWLFYGNDVFYALFLLIPVYFYFRIKGKSRR